MTTPASRMELSEVDSEVSLLGSLLMAPEAFPVLAGKVRSEWFSDGFLRYMFETACRLSDEGARLSPQPIIAALPEDCGGVRRQDLYARICAAAMPVSSISGMVSVIKDRWARREILAAAAQLKERADMFGEDPFELAGEAVVSLNSVSSDRSERRAKSLEAAMSGIAAEAERRRGATTGLLAVDNCISGYVPGQLYVFAGRPGMGKSALMCSSLRRTAQAGKGVAVFSLEMTAEEIAARVAADAMDHAKAPTFGSILKNDIHAEWQELYGIVKDSVAGLPFFIHDEARLTVPEIVAKAREAKAMFEASGVPLAVVCIDHMGLVTPSDRYRGNKVAEAGEVSGAARALAKELNCTVLLLCQLSREVEKRDDKRPIMADLRWSGEIEQDAHVVAFLYREHYYLSLDASADPFALSDAKHKIELLIRKNRNGETADLSLWCSIGHSSIRDAV